MDPVRVAGQLFASESRGFAVRLWDGAVLPPARATTAATLVLRSPRVLDAFYPPALERAIAEAYLDGDLDLEGDAIGLLEAAARWTGPRTTASLLAAASVGLVRRALHGAARPGIAQVRGPLHSVGRDRDAVRHHYDVSDDFYRLFLDGAMVYSCAWFGAAASRSTRRSARSWTSSAASSTSRRASGSSTSAAGGARWSSTRRSATARARSGSP
jgi:cyclopropane-fatty-acyl-phospholipid synthase